MFGSQYLSYEVRGGAGWLTINRPSLRNAMSLEMYRGVRRAVEAADRDPAVQLTVVTGVDDVFCVGGGLTAEALFERPEDWPGLGYLPSRDGAPVEPVPGAPVDIAAVAHPFQAIVQSQKAVVSIVNGLCIGGGFILAMVSDIAVASERATFRIPEVLRGVPDQYVASYLPAYVGLARAKYLMFTGRRFTAAEALDWGILAGVVEHDQLTQYADELVDDILRGAPIARSVYKAQANRFLRSADPDIQARASFAERVEGAVAFAEKRAPSWAPRASESVSDPEG